MVAASRSNVGSGTVSATTEPSRAALGPLVRFTVADVLAMLREGILPEDGGTELLDGLVCFKDRADAEGGVVSHGPRHRLCIRRLTKLVAAIDGTDRHAQVQLPLVCGEDQMPEPDFAIVAGTDDVYRDKLPSAADATCVLEFAGSSYERDSELKGAIYAAASIPQYLIVNLRNSTVEQYTDPDPASCRYRVKTIFVAGDVISLRLPGGSHFDINLAEILA